MSKLWASEECYISFVVVLDDRENSMIAGQELLQFWPKVYLLCHGAKVPNNCVPFRLLLPGKERNSIRWSRNASRPISVRWWSAPVHSVLGCSQRYCIVCCIYHQESFPPVESITQKNLQTNLVKKNLTQTDQVFLWEMERIRASIWVQVCKVVCASETGLFLSSIQLSLRLRRKGHVPPPPPWP